MTKASPIARAGGYALLAAIAFGATTPLIGRFGASIGPWTTAALLYAGAALAGWPAIRGAARESPIARRDVTRIAAAAFTGAMLAPAALAWGIRHTGALSASLALAFESAFTAVLAAVAGREHLGGRTGLGIIATALGGAALAIGAPGGSIGVAGLVAVVAATFLWAIDNLFTGSVADVDPGTVVVAKSALGAFGASLVALLVHEPAPSLSVAAALVAIGAVGYGASLQWYLVAQRGFGVARTASVFAAAPFVGAAIASLIGEGRAGVSIAISAALMAAGVVFHLTERHAHSHAPDPLEHEHAHTHDDFDHDHIHVPEVSGSHSHRHRHEGLFHAHPHAPDLRHRHHHGALS